MSEAQEKLQEFIVNSIKNAQTPDERKIIRDKRLKRKVLVAKNYGL